MLKKIIISGAILLTGSGYAFAACPIDALGACKADIGSGINDKLQDKILPDNLNKIKQPNNSFNNRTNLGQPHTPENIHMEPLQEQNTKPYDANCQFGNCINRGDTNDTD